MSYLYWMNHDTSHWNCNGRPLCSPPLNTGLMCKNNYENHNFASFHDLCTIRGFNVDDGVEIQFTSIGIGIIPVMVVVVLLYVVYLKQKTTIRK